MVRVCVIHLEHTRSIMCVMYTPDGECSQVLLLYGYGVPTIHCMSGHLRGRDIMCLLPPPCVASSLGTGTRRCAWFPHVACPSQNRKHCPYRKGWLWMTNVTVPTTIFYQSALTMYAQEPYTTPPQMPRSSWLLLHHSKLLAGPWRPSRPTSAPRTIYRPQATSVPLPSNER